MNVENRQGCEGRHEHHPEHHTAFAEERGAQLGTQTRYKQSQNPHTQRHMLLWHLSMPGSSAIVANKCIPELADLLPV